MQRACLLEALNGIFCFEPLDRGLFYYRLAVGNAEKLGFQAMALDGEGVFFGDVALEFKCSDAVEELGKRLGMKAAELDEHPLGRREADICPREDIKTAVKGDSAVGNGEIFAADFFDLIAQDAFKPEMAGTAKPHS